MTLRRCAVLRRSNHNRPFIIRGALLQALQLTLQLPFSLLGRLQFCPLRRQPCLSLLGLAFRLLLATLLLLFPDLALTNLLFQLSQTGFLRFLFSLELFLLSSSFLPAKESANRLGKKHSRLIRTLVFSSPPPELPAPRESPARGLPVPPPWWPPLPSWSPSGPHCPVGPCAMAAPAGASCQRVSGRPKELSKE